MAFSEVFRNVSVNLDYSLLRSLVSSLRNVKLQKSSDQLNLDRFELDSEPNFWELIARVHLLVLLLQIHPEQKEEIFVIISGSVKRLTRHSPRTNLEIELILETVTIVIDTLGHGFQNAFPDIWGFIEGQILCELEKGCPSRFYLLSEKVFQSCFALVQKLCVHFPKSRPKLFASLEAIFDSMENLKSLTTSNRGPKVNKRRKQEFLTHSRNTLERLLVSDFMIRMKEQFPGQDQSTNIPARVLRGGHLNEDQGITCGLVNLSSTCYFNSLIQQFANMEWFVKFVLENCHDLAREQFVEKIDDGRRFTGKLG